MLNVYECVRIVCACVSVFVCKCVWLLSIEAATWLSRHSLIWLLKASHLISSCLQPLQTHTHTHTQFPALSQTNKPTDSHVYCCPLISHWYTHFFFSVFFIAQLDLFIAVYKHTYYMYWRLTLSLTLPSIFSTSFLYLLTLPPIYFCFPFILPSSVVSLSYFLHSFFNLL